MDDLTSLPATCAAVREAYEMAHLTPSDIDVADGHDCFTIAEIIAGEDHGFFARGEEEPPLGRG